MTTPDPGVYITPTQMYQEVRALHDALSRVEAKLDQIRETGQVLATGHRDLDIRVRTLEEGRLPERMDDHESRLRLLEERRLPHSVLTIITAVLGTVALLWQAIGH
jgi:hypothetical protein